MGNDGRFKFPNHFHHYNPRSPSNYDSSEEQTQIPDEFICPISKSPMADPVVVSSGHSFEKISVIVCKEFGFFPKLPDGSVHDFSIIFDNINLKLTILNWCRRAGWEDPQAPDRGSVERNVHTLMERERPEPNIRFSERQLLNRLPENPPVKLTHAETELGIRFNNFKRNSQGESTFDRGTPGNHLPFTTRPSCLTSQSSSSSETIRNEEEQQLVWKLGSQDVYEQEDAVVSLRQITRTNDQARVSLCTHELLSALKSLISSTCPAVKVNAMASLVNLSLQKPNKVKIVRAGIIPLLIDPLINGSTELQEHAAGALFSLALEDDNKIAIGALGALPPLMEALRSDSERAQHDSALCLYHLTLNQTNRVKLIKLGAVPILLSMVSLGVSASRSLLILCNLTACPEGRSAMLDANAIEYMVRLLRNDEFDSESTRENCVSVLHGLSHGGFRFKGLAREARAVDVLRVVEERGTERARDKAKKILQIMRGNVIDERDERAAAPMMDSGGLSWTRDRFVGGRNGDLYSANSSNF